jgi:hypothetical protein
MKSIKDFINEALVIEGNINTPHSWVLTVQGMKKNKGDADKIAEITEWINKNYDVKKISVNFDKETGTYLVNAQAGAKLENSKLESLTNGEFTWGKMPYFSVSKCPNLKNLIGAPIMCEKEFTVEYCDSLESLEGCEHCSPRVFFIEHNKNLNSYEFLPPFGAKAMYWVDNALEISKDDKKIIAKKHGIKTVYTSRM